MTFHTRHEKSAAVLVAMARVLEETETRGPSGDELLTLYRWMSGLPADVFNRVWQDPFTYHWAIVSYELMLADLGGAPLSELTERYRDVVADADTRAALEHVLSEMRLIAAALAMLSGQDIRFVHPLHIDRPRPLPGTGSTLHGPFPLRLNGVHRGALLIDGPDGQEVAVSEARAQGTISLRRDPEVHHNGVTIRLQPSSFDLPSLEPMIRGVATVDPTFQQAGAERVREALELIERHEPETFRLMQEQPLVVALKPHDLGDYSNVSHSILPAAFVLSFVDHAHELADALVHEFRHGLLFAMEEAGAFMYPEPHDPQRDCCFYSPWRNDPRPLHGILHALYVFISVARFWLSVWQDDTQPEPLRTYALSQLHIMSLRQQLAAGELARHAAFTPHGESLFERLRNDVRALQTQAETIASADGTPALCCLADGRIDALRDPADQRPLTALEFVRQHAHRHGNREAVDALADRAA